MAELLKKIAQLFRYAKPLSLFAAELRPRVTPTSKLYILRTDFPVNAEMAAKLDAQLEPLRKKFGLEFFVMEPGVTLTRFDDI